MSETSIGLARSRPDADSEWARSIAEFQDFVLGLHEAGDDEGWPIISLGLARRAIKAWWKLFGACRDGLAIPDVGPGPDDELIFVWKRGDHYLSAEMTEYSPVEFFYRDGRTGSIWGHDFDPNGGAVPDQIVEKLSYFVDVA